MAKAQRQYTREFKIEAVQLYETSGKTMAQIERELGITPYLLSKWVKQFRDEELPPFPGKGNARDEEVRSLKREIEILKQEREILKKTVGIFSKTRRCDLKSCKVIGMHFRSNECAGCLRFRPAVTTPGELDQPANERWRTRHC